VWKRLKTDFPQSLLDLKCLGRTGAGIFLVGTLALLIGFSLLALERREEGGIDTRWGAFVGPVWFILINLWNRFDGCWNFFSVLMRA